MSTYLQHHGIRGMKWGVRRYQNDDGSLTAAGRARYLNADGTMTKKGQEASKKFRNIRKREYARKVYGEAEKQHQADIEKAHQYADRHGLTRQSVDFMGYESKIDRDGYREQALSRGLSDEYVNKMLKYDSMLTMAETANDERTREAKQKVKDWLNKYGDTPGWDIPKEI